MKLLVFNRNSRPKRRVHVCLLYQFVAYTSRRQQAFIKLTRRQISWIRNLNRVIYCNAKLCARCHGHLHRFGLPKPGKKSLSLSKTHLCKCCKGNKWRNWLMRFSAIHRSLNGENSYYYYLRAESDKRLLPVLPSRTLNNAFTSCLRLLLSKYNNHTNNKGYVHEFSWYLILVMLNITPYLVYTDHLPPEAEARYDINDIALPLTKKRRIARSKPVGRFISRSGTISNQ